MNKDKLKHEKERVNPLAMFFVKDGKVGKKTESGAMPQDGNYIQIGLDKICPNRFQPRKRFDEDSLNELAESIKSKGVIQPIVVRKLDSVMMTQDGAEYELIAGERRWRASKLAGLTQIPAVIRDDVSDNDLRTLALIENIQREDLGVMEKAMAIYQLKNTMGEKSKDIAKILGLGIRTIEKNIKIAEADEVYQNMIIKQWLSFVISDSLTSLGREIDKLKNKDEGLYGRLIKKLEKGPITEELINKINVDYFNRQSKTPKSVMMTQGQIKKENFWETAIEYGLNFRVKRKDILTDEQKQELARQAERFFTTVEAKEVIIKF